MLLRTPLFLAVTTLVAASSLSAATYTWQTAGSTNTWNNADTNWFIDAGSTLSPWADANAAVFSGTGETVTLSGTVTPTSLDVGTGNGNWTLNGAGLLAGTGTTLVKNGTGTLTLSNTAANTYTGGTTINGGILSIGTGGTGANTSTVSALGTGAVTINTGGTLRLWIQNSSSFTYTNAMTIDGGTLLSEDGVNTVSGAITVGAGGATFSAKWGGKNLVVSNVISGSGAVVVQRTAAGGGESGAMVNFNGANTYTGGTTVNSGTLQLGNAAGTDYGSIGRIRGTVTVNAGATLTLLGSNAFGYNTGAKVDTVNLVGGTLNHAGTGDNGWGVAYNLTGATMQTTSTGQFSFGNNTSVTTLDSATTSVIAGKVNMREANTGNTVVFNIADGAAATDLLVSANITLQAGGVGITKNGAGTMALTGVNTYSGTTTISAGTLQISGAGTLGGGSYAAAITNNAALKYSSSANQTLSGVISGTGTLTKDTGAGTLTLGGVNTYSGATSVNSGTLSVTGSLDAASAVAVASGATLGGTGTVTGTTTVASGGNITGGVAGTGTLTLGSLTFSDTGSINVSTLANYGVNAAVNVTDTDGLTTAGAITIKLSGVAPVGTGTAHLIQYAGTVQGTGLPAFTLDTTGITGLGARATLTLDTSVANFVNVNYAIDRPVWTGALDGQWSTATQSGSKNWVLASNGVTTTDFINGDAVTFDDTAAGTTTVTISGADVTPGSVQFNNATKTYTITGTNGITGTTSVSLTGTGTVTVNNANSYSGGTTISAGTLVAGNSGAFGSGAVAINTGGTLNVGGQILANAVTLGGGTLVGNGTLSGVLSGGALTYNSAGNTLALTGTNTYTGGTTITAGTLQIGNGGNTGTLGSGAISIASGATLSFKRNDPVTQATAITGTGTLSMDGTGTLNMTAAGSLILPTNVTVNSGTVNFSGGGFSSNALNGAGLVTINNGGTAVITSSHALGGDNATMTESVVVNSGGTLTLNSAQYFNNLTLNGATVNGTADIRISAASNIQVGGSTASSVSSIVNLVNAGNFTVADATGNTNTDLLVSGVISNSGALNKAGAGTMRLTGTNTYAGATNINEGTLVTGNIAAFGSSTAVSVSNGAALQIGDGTANTVTLASGATLAVASGGVLKLGDAAAAIALQGAGGFTLGSGAIIDLGGLFDSLGSTTTYSLITGGSGTKTAGATVIGFSTGVFSSVTFDNTGTLTFTAVPEPSTYGLIGAGALAAVAFVRRRRKKSA